MLSGYCHSYLWCIPTARHCADWDTARIGCPGLTVPRTCLVRLVDPTSKETCSNAIT